MRPRRRATRWCTEGPDAVRRLIALGARFDTDAAGDIALTREGGHLRDRIAHAGGDATGAEIFRALVAAVADDAGIELVEHALALDLLVDDRGAVQGLTLHVMGEGQRDGVGAVLAPAVVLATGGLGQVFTQSTNPRSPPATAWRWRCAPAPTWPTWSSCSSTPPCCGSGRTPPASSRW